jgi:large subunit ribosomal protein L22
MIAKARSKYIRISPFKMRRIANEIRNKQVVEAEAYLSVLPNKGAAVLKKLIHSARSNYLVKERNAAEEDLYVTKILVDGATAYKRYHPIARGRVQPILKRTCHVFLEVSTKEEIK